MTIRFIGLLALWICGTGFLAKAQAPPMPQLMAAVKALDENGDMRSASWSITVMDGRTGQPLLMHNAHRSLATASTMKAVTTATALAVLGPDYRFRTLIQIDGVVSRDSILNGNLFIKGSGDPTLGSNRFADDNTMETMFHQWALAVRAAGINRINGMVIGDASIFSSQLTPGNWGWEDMGNYYGAGACGLNIHENQYRLDLKPGSTVGSGTRVIRTDPFIPGLTFINELKTGRAGSGDNGYIYGSPYTFERYIRGTIPAGVSSFSIKGSIPDPALFSAQVFKETLASCGIRVMGGPSTIRIERIEGRNHTASRRTIHTHFSPNLREIVRETNMQSINLYAEALANKVSVELGKKGNTAQASDAMEDYWQGKGVNTRGMYLRDGSGLSSNNVLSTYQLTSILVKAQQARYFAAFDQSLPVAGRSGSLKRMLRGTVAEGRLRAKSGYISGVRSYAGYVETVNGKLLAFSMIANNYSGSAGSMRRKFETLMVKLAAGK